MRFSILMLAALLSGSVANAQNDPVVMTINGQPVTRSEFEYSYNKNNSETVVDKKSVDEYAELFINNQEFQVGVPALPQPADTSVVHQRRRHREGGVERV